MLCIHYEEMQMPNPAYKQPTNMSEIFNDNPQYLNYVRLVASGSVTTICRFYRQDWKEWENYMFMMKQLPSSRRSFDPVDNIWSIPLESFDIIFAQATKQLHSGLPDGLNSFIHPPKRHTQSAWEQKIKSNNIKAEEVEDFFYGNVAESIRMPIDQIRTELIKIMSPYVSFDFDKYNDDITDRAVLLRGYKLTARSLHPDNQRTGNAALMSQLNQLWAAYKEVVK